MSTKTKGATVEAVQSPKVEHDNDHWITKWPRGFFILMLSAFTIAAFVIAILAFVNTNSNSDDIKNIKEISKRYMLKPLTF